MVRIPTVQIETAIPVTERPGQAGRAWEAMAGLGDAGRRLALGIAQQEGEMLRKKKALRETVELAGVQVEIQEANEGLITALRRSPNPDTYFLDWDAGFADIVADRINRIEDPDTRIKADILSKRMQTRELVEQKHYANQLWVGSMRAKTEKAVDGFVRAGDAESAMRLMDDMADQGVYPADAAELKKQSIRNRVNVGLVKAGINVDPDSINELLKKYEVSPEQEIILRDRAERIKEKREREEEKERINAVYSELKKDWGDDYSVMLKTLRDPKFQERTDLTGKQANQVEQLLKSEWATVEHDRNRRHEDTSRRLFADLVFREELPQGRKLTLIDAAVSDDQLSWQVGEHFRNAVINPPTVKTDYAEFNSIFRAIGIGADREEINARILTSKRLSTEDKKVLGNMLWKEVDITSDDWLKQARKYLDSQIVPKRGMLEKIARTPREEQDYYNAIKALDDIMGKARAAGKPIEGSDIYDLAVKIAPMYRRSLAERMADMYITMQEQGIETKKIMGILKKGKKYETPESVKEALDKKELTAEEAVIILRHKFKME